MADPFVAEIRIFAVHFAPRDGRCATASSCRSRRIPRCSRCSAPITAATASRLSRCPTCRAALGAQGQVRAGTSAPRPVRRRAVVTLLLGRDAAHNHVIQGGDGARAYASARPIRPMPAGRVEGRPYPPPRRPTSDAAQTLSAAGSGLPHNNMQPYLT